MCGEVINNQDALTLCLETFAQGRTVSLPNGRFFPSSNVHEKELKRKVMMKKILDYGKEYVVVQNDNRGLVLGYLN